MTGRSVTETDSEWTDADRAVAIALMAEQNERCRGCGQLLSECRDPSTSGRWTVEEQVCHSCVVGQAASENLAEDKRRGVHVYTVLNR